MTSWVKFHAPVRILDAGGWTDTWFAGHGVVCHLCVGPGAQASARMVPTSTTEGAQVQLRVPDFDDCCTFSLASRSPASRSPASRSPASRSPASRSPASRSPASRSPASLSLTSLPLASVPSRHALLEATIRRWAPPGCSLEIVVSSGVPSGSSLGTSAAVVVALVGALQTLGGHSPAPATLAHAAHEVETVDLGRQCGVQDQVAAAFGGANLVRITPYPEFAVSPLHLSPATWEALARRVVTVYMGSHDSSAVHNTVIQDLAGDDGRLQPMRAAAARAATALAGGDLDAYGEAMTANTVAQAALHPTLVNPVARRVISVSAALGAVGWKVNGAGGAGGTVSVVGPDDPGPLVAALGEIEGVTLLHMQPASEGAQIVDQG